MLRERFGSKTRYSHSVRELVRKSPWFFLLVTLTAVALRLFFIVRFPAITDDSHLYADIAGNWFQHGIYGVTDDHTIVPTYTRLPGYPAFLGLIFAIFGPDSYRAVMLAQMAVDIGTCLVVTDLARRVLSPRAAKTAFLLAALCPFLADYSAAALTETLEIFFTALALDFAIAGLAHLGEDNLLPFIGCGAAVGAGILLRPDGGILLAAIELYLAWVLVNEIRGNKPSVAAEGRPTEERQPPVFRSRGGNRIRGIIVRGILVAAIALAPLLPWTIRNLRTFHRFQPLAPRYANEEEEFVPMGFNRWVKTWMADYVSVQEIYWNVPGEAVEVGKLPSRSFDSAEQRRRTLDLFTAYNRELHVTPDLDYQFANLAKERIHAHPWRYYLCLPLARIADMWLRPRTELLPPDPRWWEFNDDRKWSAVAVGFGMINLFYVGAALAGLLRSFGLSETARVSLGLLVLYVVLRSLFLGTLENPEPRYTLECYPVVILLAAFLASRGQS
jgi:hypothetical protein